MSGKVILFGIDGADWSFLERWIKAGHMPNLARLTGEGTSAPLASVVPLNSASAWVSMMTGKNPGGHGVFGFVKNADGAYRRRTVTSGDIAAATLWEIANAAGRPAGSVNCPITYPPLPVEGFMVSGIITPYNGLWAHPPELESELRGLFGPYLVDVPWAEVDERTPGQREKFLADLYLLTRKQEEVALRCAASREWNIMGIFCTGTDRVMHRFWHHTDPDHPAYDEEASRVFGDEIRKYFSLADEVLGRVLREAGDASVIVASDHGFGPLYHRFYLRKWLADMGYLAENGNSDAEVAESLRGIDLGSSRAFPAALSESGIWINLEGRQPEGTVSPGEYEKLRSRIINELNVFRTNSGTAPVKKAMKREDALKGPFTGEAPDILIEPADTFIVDDSFHDKLIDVSIVETGTHRSRGIFVARGEGVRAGASLDEVNVTDVLPTLLALGDIPIPEDIEGRVVKEAFKSDPKAQYRPPLEIKRPGEEKSDAEEERKKRMLKGLGYL